MIYIPKRPWTNFSVQYLFGSGISIYSIKNNLKTNVAFSDDSTCVLKQEALIPSSSNFTTLYGNNPEYPESNLTEGNQKWTFSSAWDLNYSIPFYCLAVFVLLNMKNDAIFNRFSAFGSFTNFCLLAVLIYKAVAWNELEHINFHDKYSKSYIHQFSASGAIVLSGYLQGAYIGFRVKAILNFSHLIFLYVSHIC